MIPVNFHHATCGYWKRPAEGSLASFGECDSNCKDVSNAAMPVFRHPVPCRICGQKSWFSMRMPPEWTCERCSMDGGQAKTTEEGVKYDSGKARWDLLPFDALDEVAEVLRYGANKYAARNWEKGMAWSRLLGAALRHLGAWALGNDVDEESEMPHLAHAACCVLMLLALVERGVGADDRK